MPRYAFFPGCVISAKYPHFESATRAVLEALEVELVDLAFGCCPPTSNMKMVHYDSWLALAARNLCLAEEAGLDILTTCTGCVSTLREANHIMKNKPNRRRKINNILKQVGKEYHGTIKVSHVLDVLCYDLGPERIQEKVVHPLDFRVACHYGCHLFRPPQVHYPDRLSPSQSFVPTSMDLLLSVLGCEPVEYSRKFLCCGFPLGANVDEEASNDIVREKLFYIHQRNVDLISVACASCFEQFEVGQVMLKKKYKDSFKIPTMYLTQLLGLALGVERSLLGLNEHIIKTKKLLQRLDGNP